MFNLQLYNFLAIVYDFWLHTVRYYNQSTINWKS